MQLLTPFHSLDHIRNAKFLALYNWAKGLEMNHRRAYFIAKKKTLKEYPIKKGEPLYP
jgi:hypothetical protein